MSADESFFKSVGKAMVSNTPEVFRISNVSRKEEIEALKTATLEVLLCHLVLIDSLYSKKLLDQLDEKIHNEWLTINKPPFDRLANLLEDAFGENTYVRYIETYKADESEGFTPHFELVVEGHHIPLEGLDVVMRYKIKEEVLKLVKSYY